MCLRFHLNRKVDHSGVSGVSDNIAEGVLFKNGEAVIKWNSEHSSIAIYHDLQDLIRIHGHGGSTTVVFDDPVVELEKKEEINKDGK